VRGSGGVGADWGDKMTKKALSYRLSALSQGDRQDAESAEGAKGREGSRDHGIEGSRSRVGACRPEMPPTILHSRSTCSDYAVSAADALTRRRRHRRVNNRTAENVRTATIATPATSFWACQ